MEDPAGVQMRREAEAIDIIEEAKARSQRMMAESFEAIRREKEAMLREKEAAIAELESEREKILRELAEKAHSDAETRVHGEIKPRLEGAVAEFEALVQETERILGQVLENHRDEMVDLALKIAQLVVGEVALEKRDIVVQTAVKCLEVARDRQEMVVRVHPEDLRILQEFEMTLIERFDDLKKLTIEEDRRVDRGGVWVETPSGFIDGRIRTQLDEIVRSVLPDSRNSGNKRAPDSDREKTTEEKEPND
ncbi:MAG: hypothetical protein KC931_12325 [Candidatus Omnitrophica bacterium]|nr:hypothetical protein [Candidatus Omnitrophota bacterium]